MFTGKVSYVSKGGSIYARGTFLLHGKRKQVWRRVVSTKAVARAEVEQEINNQLAGRKDMPETFADLAEYYSKNIAVEPVFRHGEKIRGMNTWKTTRNVIGQLKTFFGRTPLVRMTRERITAYKLHIVDSKVRHVRELPDDGPEFETVVRREGNRTITRRVRRKPKTEEYWAPRSLASVNQHLRLLRTMLKFAESENWITEAPSFKKIISSAAEPPRDIYPTEEEFARLLEKCDRPHLRAVILLIADTGARPVELWRLKWKDDLDFSTGYITYTSHKGIRTTRASVPMTKRVIAALDDLPQINEYVFGGIKSIKKPWARLKREANVNVDLYSLRHVFATRIDSMPLSQTQKQKLMRHTTGAMFGRYAKVTPVTVEDVRDMLDSSPYLPSKQT